MLLQAEAFDPDGSVQEVKFYGNGALLGNAPLGNLTSIDIVSPGNGFQDAPTVTISGGGGQGAGATRQRVDQGHRKVGWCVTAAARRLGHQDPILARALGMPSVCLQG